MKTWENRKSIVKYNQRGVDGLYCPWTWSVRYNPDSSVVNSRIQYFHCSLSNTLESLVALSFSWIPLCQVPILDGLWIFSASVQSKVSWCHYYLRVTKQPNQLYSSINTCICIKYEIYMLCVNIIIYWCLVFLPSFLRKTKPAMSSISFSSFYWLLSVNGFSWSPQKPK